MKNFKKLLVMLMVMTLTLGSIGCGTKNTGNNSNSSKVENSETNQTTQNNETSNTEAAYPVEITDSDGNVITIDEEPEKIISVAPNMTELIYALGEGSKLIGRSDYCDMPEEVTSVPSVGTLYTPDIEAIVALEPDIVLVSTHFEEENETKLKDLGITVLCFYEENDIYGVYTMIESLGKLLNRTDKAEELIQDMKDTFDSVTTAIKGQEQPSVYYVVGYGEYGDYTAGGDTFINGLITLAGGNNVAKDVSGWTYSLESLLEADPDVIIVGIGEAEAFSTAEHYCELTAVKEGRVYEFDGYHLFDRQGYRNAEGVKELAKLLYPELVK